jgi:hypothetical protein
MKFFRSLTPTGQAIFLGDPKISEILSSMTVILTRACERAEMPPELISKVGVCCAPYPYNVWAGNLGYPWDRVVQAAFRKLATILRYRWNHLHAIIRDAKDLTNGAGSLGLGENASGGVGGIVEEGSAPSTIIQGQTTFLSQYLTANGTTYRVPGGKPMDSDSIAYIMSGTEGEPLPPKPDHTDYPVG